MLTDDQLKAAELGAPLLVKEVRRLKAIIRSVRVAAENALEKGNYMETMGDIMDLTGDSE